MLYGSVNAKYENLTLTSFGEVIIILVRTFSATKTDHCLSREGGCGVATRLPAWENRT